jgi:hypothetical protein
MALTELECPKCATVAVNRDFCSCGEYLGWELTLDDLETSEPASYRAPQPPAPRAATLLTLRDPARAADEAGAAVRVAVAPGEAVAVLATVRNQGEIVDTFELRVDGLPDGWTTVTSPTLFLNPWGTAGDYEQEVLIRLHPPRTSAAEARVWPLTVVAHSRSLGADVASAGAELVVAPFTSTAMRAGPERRRGRRHARFEVAVANHGNAPVELGVAARHTEALCPVSVAPARATVPVGATVTALVLVGAPRPLWFKRPVDHHVDVWHRTAGGDSPPQRVTFRQKPWLPWWLPPVLALLAAFVAAILLLRRDPEVPKLEGDTVAEAVVVLEKKKLQLGDTTYAHVEGARVGTIVAQSPAAGDDIVKGEPVHVTVAAAAQVAVVPDVSGVPLAEAVAKLRTARLGVDPQPSAAGNDWVVIRQDPAAGAKQEVGTKVTLAVEQRNAAAAPLGGGGAAAAGAAGAALGGAATAGAAGAATGGAATGGAAGAATGGAAGGGAAAAVPAIPVDPPAAPHIPADSPAASSGSASTPVPAPAASPKPAAAQVASKPVKLRADLVFAGATSGQLYRWDGEQAARLTAPRHRFETPVATEDGYVAVQVLDDTRRLARISADGKTVEPIADGDFARPAYSPVRGLLAVAGAGRLCVADPSETAAPTCAARRGLSAPAWAPDGRSVLALASGRLLSYAAYGGDASRWKAPKTVYRAAVLRAAVWIDDERVAVLAADRRGRAAHVRVLERRADGRFTAAKAFPAHTGHELAAVGEHVALRRGKVAQDGPMVLLDLARSRPRVRALPNGVNPTWAE